MNETNLKTLNSIPLTEVMRAWGHQPKFYTKKGTSALFICPWHNDHHPSLSVDLQPANGSKECGFKCFACHQTGVGAIQLAARLMGLPAGPVPKEQLNSVLAQLATKCNVQLEPENNEKPFIDTLRVNVIGWDDFKESEKQYAYWTGQQAIFEPGEWTEEAITALGIKVELATHRVTKDDLNSSSTENNTSATVKIGDTATEFDPDSGQPLYRCSFGTNFYRGTIATAKTIAEWGREIEKTFNVKPVSRFLKRDNPKKGGVVVLSVKSTKNYPIFSFQYPWGVKKYEPKSSYGGTKWTWWNLSDDAELDRKWYADSALTDMLEGAIPQADKQHPFTVIEKDKQGEPVKIRFKRVVLCSGPRDAIAVYSHTNAHVIWLHSEQSGFNSKADALRPNRWLRALLRKLKNITEEGGLYVCYDEDQTGISASQAIAVNCPYIHWLRLPRELTQITCGEKHLKDVTDFIERFSEVEAMLPADLQHDDPVDWFDNALFDTPTTQFWQWESERKDADGTGRARYKFDLRNTPVFLRARGMARRIMQQGKSSFSRFFMLGSGNIYTEIFQGEKGNNKLVSQARELMADWLRAHKEYNDDKGALSRSIYSAKLEQTALENIEVVDFNEKSFGDDFDHFFFENTAVMVSANEIEMVPYSRMKWWTNSEAILPGHFTIEKQAWHVSINPLYEAQKKEHEQMILSLKTPEERAQENMRFDAISSLWKYRLCIDKPIDEMPLHFQFLYNASRIFWEKEQAGETLTDNEKQAQDMYFIAMMHAIGSALVRHRSANRQQFLHITDNGTRREDLASGGTGKTAILELFALVRQVLKVDGKALEGGNITLTQELDKVVPGLHTIIALDELPQGFSPKTLYNYTLSMTSRGLYRQSVVLEGDDLPKFVIASNEQLDLSSDSTSRRAYQLLVSDWYHPRSIDGSRQAHTPADDFLKKYGIKEVARNLTPKLLNEARNFMLSCCQLFLQFPDDTIRPPRDSRAMLRQALAASKDEQFTRWIAEYLADNRHIAQPIAQRELAISLLDYCGITVGEKTIKQAFKRIRDNLDDYIRTSVYVLDPPVVLLTPTDREHRFRRCAAWQHPKDTDGYSIATDSNGNRLPRELIKKAPYPRVYYFYHKTKVPRHFYDEEHIGNNDYVQPAPENDPESETTITQ